MNQAKDINSFLTIIFIIIIVICGIVILGISMNDKWKNMRDIKRHADIKSVVKAIDIYYLDNNRLPDNVTDSEWDSSYDLETSNQTLFKVLRDSKLLSPIFDPKNNEEYHYRYHKFRKGQYGCNKAFAIFQVTKFESEVSDYGRGECPDKNFVLEAPNGFTYQWFE
jgi:hypothetical protein